MCLDQIGIRPNRFRPNGNKPVVPVHFTGNILSLNLLQIGENGKEIADKANNSNSVNKIPL